ncbi:hypothetical protein MN608_07845 [Microdochium nivale]|nr:hypothetical protein MN608_07845 [Microdochium nivale]
MQSDQPTSATGETHGKQPDEANQTSPSPPGPISETPSSIATQLTQPPTAMPPPPSPVPSTQIVTGPQHPMATSLFVSEQQLRSSYTYCYDRGNGIYTRLVALDMLPPLGEVPSVQNDCLGMIVLPQPSAPAPPGSHVGVSEGVSWQTHQGSSGNPGCSCRDVQTTIDTIVESTTPTTIHAPSLPSPSDQVSFGASQHPQHGGHVPLQHGQASAARNTRAALIGNNSSPAGDSPTTSRNKRLKIYCDKWVHEGVCAFTQQGCKFKHEMPLDRATQHQLGLFHGLPAWWKKQQSDAAKQNQHHHHHHQGPHQQLLHEPVYMLQPRGMQPTGDGGGSSSVIHGMGGDAASAFEGLQLGHEYNDDHQFHGSNLAVSQQLEGINNAVPGQFPYNQQYPHSVSSSADNFYTANSPESQGIAYTNATSGGIGDMAFQAPAAQDVGTASSVDYMAQNLPGLARSTQHLSLDGANGTSSSCMNTGNRNLYYGRSAPGQALPLGRGTIMSTQPWGGNQHFSPTTHSSHLSTGFQTEPSFTDDGHNDFPGISQPQAASPAPGTNFTFSNTKSQRNNYPRTPSSRIGFASRFGPIAPPPAHALSNNQQASAAPSPSPATAAASSIASPFRSGGATGIWARAPFSANVATFSQASAFQPQQQQPRLFQSHQQQARQRGQHQQQHEQQRNPSAHVVVGSISSAITNSSGRSCGDSNSKNTSSKGGGGSSGGSGNPPGNTNGGKNKNQSPWRSVSESNSAVACRLKNEANKECHIGVW